MRRIWTSATVICALVLALFIPAPIHSGRQSGLFSVVGSDYISPLISSSRAIQTLNARLNSYAHFAGYDQLQAFVRYGSVPELANITRFCGEIFSVLGIETIRRAESKGEGGKAFISESFWKRVFHESAEALGQTIQIAGESYQVAGVVRSSAELLSNTEVWIPISSRGPYGTMTSLRVVGHLMPGAEWRAGEKQLRALMQTEIVKEQVVEIDAVRLLPVERRIVFYSSENGRRVPIDDQTQRASA